MSERTLTFLRHAKSSWKEGTLADMERPLNKRGRRDAVIVARQLLDNGVTFSSIYSSPARRCRETITRMLLALPARDVRLCFDHALYTFERNSLLQGIRQLDDSVDDAMLVGHNPAMHDTLCWITGMAIAKFPTCAAAQVSLSLRGWKKLHEGCGQLRWMVMPDR